MKPFEMANIYWSWMKSSAIREVKNMLGNMRSAQAKIYWNEVLKCLFDKKNKKVLH